MNKRKHRRHQRALNKKLTVKRRYPKKFLSALFKPLTVDYSFMQGVPALRTKAFTMTKVSDGTREHIRLVEE